MSNWGAQIQINMLEQKTSIYSHLFHPRILITLVLLPQVPGVASHGPLTPNLLQVAGHDDRADLHDHAGLDDHAGQDKVGIRMIILMMIMLITMLKLIKINISTFAYGQGQGGCPPPLTSMLNSNKVKLTNLEGYSQLSALSTYPGSFCCLWLPSWSCLDCSTFLQGS